MSQRRLELFVPTDPNLAIGLAVRVMMHHPAFSRQPFGAWAETLDGQVKRGHHAFAMDETRQVVGFIGYGLVPKAKAEAWSRGERELTNEDCLHGDCIVVHAWVASDRVVNAFLVNAVRRIMLGRDTIYYKRVYRNGASRIVAMPVGAFIKNHLDRAARISLWKAPDALARVA